MKMLAQWLEDALSEVQYEKVGFKMMMLGLIVLAVGAVSLYILLNSP